MNTEIANTESLLFGKYRVRFLRASGHSFVNQLGRTLVLCVCLSKGILFDVSHWFINFELTTNRTIIHVPAWSLCNTLIFSIRHITAFLGLGTPDKPFSTEPTWNSKVTSKRQNSVALNRLCKGHYWQYESWNKKARASLCDLRWQHAWRWQIFTTLLMPLNACKNTVHIDFRDTNKF